MRRFVRFFLIPLVFIATFYVVLAGEVIIGFVGMAILGYLWLISQKEEHV